MSFHNDGVGLADSFILSIYNFVINCKLELHGVKLVSTPVHIKSGVCTKQFPQVENSPCQGVFSLCMHK